MPPFRIPQRQPLRHGLRARQRPAPIGLTPFEQSQRSWARSVGSYEEVPAEYRAFFEPLQTTGQPFPLVVIAPSFEGFLHREVERLVCATMDEIAILERRGQSLAIRRFPIAKVHCVQFRSVLLDARLKIMGLEAGRSEPDCASVRFNAVTEFLFAPIVARIRSGAERSSSRPVEGQDVFGEWGKRNLKLMNYARRTLIGEGEVHQAILQSAIRVPVFSAFGRTYVRTITPAHATILTERELILIREVPGPGGRESYGGVWDYMPLAKIDHLSVRGGGQDLVGLTVRLPGGVRLDLQYEASAAGELDSLLAQVSELGQHRSRQRAEA